MYFCDWSRVQTTICGIEVRYLESFIEIKCRISVKRKHILENRRKTLLLLTDGQPNVVPEGGHLTALREYIDNHPGFSTSIHTFGFGYNLDSPLLLDLAKEGTYFLCFSFLSLLLSDMFSSSPSVLNSLLLSLMNFACGRRWRRLRVHSRRAVGGHCVCTQHGQRLEHPYSAWYPPLNRSQRFFLLWRCLW